MKNQNIFQKNVVLPDIVRTKAEDTLANLPDYTVPAQPHVNTNRRRKKMLVRAIAFVSAAAAVLLILFVAKIWSNRGSHENLFTITVNAKEMEEGGSIPLIYPEDMLAYSGWFSQPDCFGFGIDFDVLGDEVQKVEYSFYNSFAQVEYSGMRSETFHGTEIKPYHEDFAAEPSGNPRGYPEVRYYGQYTIDYPFTDKKYFYFELIKEINDSNLVQMYEELQPEMLKEEIVPDGSIRHNFAHTKGDEEYIKYYSRVLEDVVVTVTIHLKNGYVEKRYIAFRGALIKEPWTEEDGTVTVLTRDGIECYFLTDEEVKKIDFDHPSMPYETIS